MLRSSPTEYRAFVAKVSDFGLSKFMSPMKTHHSTRSHGTITHMPPEMLRSGTLTKFVDVYSFAVILWELVTGKTPFQGLNHYQIMYKILEENGLASYIPEDCPPPLRDLLTACWATDRM